MTAILERRESESLWGRFCNERHRRLESGGELHRRWLTAALSISSILGSIKASKKEEKIENSRKYILISIFHI
jgi:hypothetical protein